MSKHLILVLLCLLLAFAPLAFTSRGGPSDSMTPTAIVAGVVGLAAAIGVGKNNFSLVLFTICGSLIGFSVSASLTPDRNESYVIPISLWLGYVFTFVAVGYRTFLNAKRPGENQS